MRERCRHECGDTECLDFEQCFFGATSCGACIYLGGVWCPAKAKCTSSLAACNLSCGRDCVQRDAECAACERFDLPLRCSRLLPVIIVSALSSAVFLAALAWTLYEGHRAMPKPISGSGGAQSQQDASPARSAGAPSPSALESEPSIIQ